MTPIHLSDANGPRPARLLIVFGVMLAVIGSALLVGGVRLASLGGSWYYALAGACTAASGVLFALRKKSGVWLYGLTFAATIAWALWEVGWSFWPLWPRLVAPAVIATVALLLLPSFASRGITGAAKSLPLLSAAALAACLAAAGMFAFTAHGGTRQPFVASAAPARIPVDPESANDWRHYGRTPAGTRYAPIDQINPGNVGQLAVAWTFHTGDTPTLDAADQNTPLQIGDTVYACSPHNIIDALDAETGGLRWRFDPAARSPIWQRCRGVSYYKGSSAAGDCAERIVMTTIDARLIELDAKTGKPCQGFGEAGTVDLKKGMGEVKPGFYFQTSAPTVMRNLILVGGWVWDNYEVGEPSGAIRTFDARTGELVWAWDLGNPAITRLPPDGGGYTRGTPNVWSTPAFDDRLGLVYLPTGNATPDYFGGTRSKASEDYSSSVVALDIATGRERWRFQTAHHDLWDYDVPAQPALYDIPDGHGGTIAALVQVTKRGQIFLLDRRDGTPIAPVEERPVVQTGGAKEDFLSPTQPYSVGMPSVGTEALTEARMWGTTPLDQLYCRIRFREMRYAGEFTPPGVSPSLEYPGFYGGMNWGGAAIDENRGLLVVNDIRLAAAVQLVARAQADDIGQPGAHAGVELQEGTPYAVSTGLFMSPLNVPCTEPPYGTMTAIDLATRKVVWQEPMGTLEDTGRRGFKIGLRIPIGLPTLGGPMTTASGLTFFAGTQDDYLRAIDTTTGTVLWQGRLPVGAQATPMTYVSPVSGRQFVLVSAGGARQSSDRGDYIIAFALPAQPKQ